LTPNIGAPSETFIARHARDLCPGQTVVVAEAVHPMAQPGASFGVPELNLGAQPVWTLARIARGVARRVGLPVADFRVACVTRFLKQQRVEAILAEYLDHSLLWLPIARALGIRFFAHAHGYDVSRVLRDPAWAARYRDLAQADGVITVSEASRQRVIALGLAPDKVHVIPCGVEVPAVLPRRKQSEVVRCLAVGRMVPKKAPILLLDSFRRAVNEYPRMHLDYVGAGPLLPAARDFVSAMGMDASVTLHGAQPHGAVKGLFAAADVFVQHSVVEAETGDEEGLPVAILEAMAAGLPLVSTLHAGIPEAVLHGVTGYLVDEGDTVTMAEHIGQLAASPDLRASMGAAGWARARERYTWDRERAELLRIMGLDG
jgi:glycosyltransferase involved in cell wall biosynthesis